MTDRGQQVDILKVLGSEDGEPTPDPNLAVLIARMEQLEKEQRLQALYREQAETAQSDLRAELNRTIKEKDEAIEGLKAALEAREQAMKKQPQDPQTTQLVINELTKEVRERAKHKRARFIKDLRAASKGTVDNLLGHSVLLTINGVSSWVVPGKNELPGPFVSAWEDYLEDLRFAQERRTILAGGEHEFDQLEELLAEGRQGEHSGRTWYE